MSNDNNFQSLSTTEQRQVNEALTDIAVALDDNNIHVMNRLVALIPAQLFDELRAYLGSIRDAQYRLTELFYNTEVREPDVVDVIEAGIEAVMQVAKLSDDCDPHGIPRPVLDGLTEDFERGVVVHPCMAIVTGEVDRCCDHIVAYDDEMFCFEHSPDEGSSVRGYSWRARHLTTDEMVAAHTRYVAQLQRGVITQDEFIHIVHTAIAAAEVGS